MWVELEMMVVRFFFFLINGCRIVAIFLGTAQRKDVNMSRVSLRGDKRSWRTCREWLTSF